MFVSNICYGQSEGSVGTVVGIRGKVFKLVPTTGIKRKKIMLIDGMGVFEGDIIATEKDAYVELEMADSTALSLAESSSFVIKKFQYVPGEKRVAHYHQSWGSLRAKVRRSTKANESIQFNTKHVEVGIEDSEFLSNSYFVNNKATNDLLLLEGKVMVKVDHENSKSKRFELKKGILFNSNFLKANGYTSFPKIKTQILGLLVKTRDFFLPRAQAANGSFKDINWDIEKKILQRNFLKLNIDEQVTPQYYDYTSLQSMAH